MSLAACIIRWPCTTRWPGWLVAALGQVVLQHRPGRLLDLQEQRVLLVAALEQADEGPGADAAHPHHLAGHVDQLEPLQQPALIVPQGGPVGAELLAEHPLHLVGGQAVGRFQVTGWDHDRGLADDPVLAVDQLTELGQRLQAVAGVCLGGALLRAVFSACLAALAFFLEAFLASAAALWTPLMSSSSSRWAYQMSMVPIWAKLAIASR